MHCTTEPIRQLVPSSGCLAGNALSFSWKDLKAYAFPHFALIKDCLFKIRRESAEIVLICPQWPGQPGFPLLSELTTDIPIIILPHHQLLSSVEGHQHPLIETGSITLTAWNLSGVISQAEAFSSNVVNLLLAGVRPTTQTAYQSPWSSWCDWCTQRNINPLSNAINNVLEFLSNLFAQGKAYNTINVARSMLSAINVAIEC